MTEKSKRVLAIRIERAEGFVHECKTVVCASWPEADKVIMEMSRTAPEEGRGYHKVDVHVAWFDGTMYATRLDMNKGCVSISRVVKDEIAFWAGVRCPGHMDRERYESARKWAAEHRGVSLEERDEHYRRILTELDVVGWPEG